jgi:hypothetical protein
MRLSEVSFAIYAEMGLFLDEKCAPGASDRRAGLGPLGFAFSSFKLLINLLHQPENCFAVRTNHSPEQASSTKDDDDAEDDDKGTPS